ncbi:hypothetical protein JCM8547_004451 [Rhodosporidiobolus lusitaniae]
MSYRPSLHPGGGFAPSSSSAASQALSQALLDKQREFNAFSTVQVQSRSLRQFLEHFADKYDVLDGGSEAVGDVVEHWQNVFRVTGLALASIAEKRAAQAAPTEDGASPSPADVVLPPGTLPDKLVRIPVQQEEGSVSPA